MTTSTIKKKKRVSKKSKLSWRKHVNIDDVEEFLEDQRLEERLGPPLETVADEQLFELDTQPKKTLSKKERLKLKLSKPPRCFQILEPFTNVPDPIKKRNRVRSKEERKNELIKKREERDRANGVLQPREIQSIEDRKKAEEKRKTLPKRGDFNMNIWGEDDPTEIEKDDWFNNNTKKHNLVGTGKVIKTIKRPTRSKDSIIPSVELPHPGMSYNPSFEDHQNLLKEIAEKEKKIIKEEEHLDRVTNKMFSKVTPEEKEANWLEEMSQGLDQVKEEKSDNETDDEYKSVNPPVKNAKKTAKQRRKQKEQQKLELMRKNLKLEKKKIGDIHRLKLLNKQIEEMEKKSKELNEKRKRAKLLKAKEAKRLSSIKFEEADLDFNLGTDIAGNLRNMKKEGNLLSDRYKSLQKRNIVEPAVRQHRKKAKVKVIVKASHKIDVKRK